MNMDFDNNTLDIIDLDLGIKLANNKADLAKILLKMLIDELPENKITIQKAFDNKDFEILLKEVHKLHGGLCYCGVPRLKKAALSLEIALKEAQSKPETIADLVKAISLEMEQVLLRYETIYQS